jgi:hypothetical protein
MDATRFDRLTCALGRATSRRVALAAVLGGVLAPLRPDRTEAADRHGTGKGGKAKDHHSRT